MQDITIYATTDFNSHAHVERDFVRRQYDVWKNNFNSHAHVERDVYRFELFLDLFISTHTLTWSVTIACPSSCCPTSHFNSHAHVERDETRIAVQAYAVHFNSHAHVERDVKMFLEHIFVKNFNSHAHVERDTCFVAQAVKGR